MNNLGGIFCMMTLLRLARSVLVIPDTVSYETTRMVYYVKKSTWYQAGRLCQANGGHLVLVDGQHVADQLQELKDNVGSLSAVHTRMVRHDNQLFYDNQSCILVNTSSWSWQHAGDADWDATKQCVLADGNTFKWKKRRCDDEDEYVCEYPGAACQFRTEPTISLASVPVNNATMGLCQDMCLQMIGCFAVAPGGGVTVPPFTHCLFVVVQDDTNPMATLACQGEYFRDDTSNAKAEFPDFNNEPDPGANPDDCFPENANGSQTAWTDQWPLTYFLMETSVQNSARCSNDVIVPSTVLETVYVTMTPDVITAYVTTTPDPVTIYVTTTPDVHTSYVTLTPDVQIVYVTPSPEIETSTAYVTVSPFSVITTYVSTTVVTTAEVILTSTLCSTLPPQSLHGCPTTITPTSSSTFHYTTSTTSSITNKTKEEVLEKISSVVKELTVNPREMSKMRRKKESAPDNRPSAQTMGVTAGFFLLLPPLLIFLMDLPHLYQVFCRQHRLPCIGSKNHNSP